MYVFNMRLVWFVLLLVSFSSFVFSYAPDPDTTKYFFYESMDNAITANWSLGSHSGDFVNDSVFVEGDASTGVRASGDQWAQEQRAISNATCEVMWYNPRNPVKNEGVALYARIGVDDWAAGQVENFIGVGVSAVDTPGGSTHWSYGDLEGGSKYNSSVLIRAEDWTNLTITVNGTGTTYWIDRVRMPNIGADTVQVKIAAISEPSGQGCEGCVYDKWRCWNGTLEHEPLLAEGEPNVPPNDQGVRIDGQGGTNTTSDQLECTFSPTDNNSETTLFYNVSWFQDGVFYSITQGSTTNGTTINSLLTSVHTEKGEVFICQVEVCDDEVECNEPKNSTVLTILNTPPNTVNVSSPVDGDHDNENILPVVFNVTDDDFDVMECNLSVNGTLMDTNLSVTSGNITTLYANFSSDGEYAYFVLCGDGTDTTTSDVRVYVYDTVNPVITWNFPLQDNSSGQGGGKFVDLDVRGSDVYLNEFEINCTQSVPATGDVVFWNYSQGIDDVTFNFTETADFSLALNESVVSCEVCFSDDHTAREIPDYVVEQKSLRTLSFGVPSNGDVISVFLSDIRVYDSREGHTGLSRDKEIDSLNVFGTEKEFDRYTFSVGFVPKAENAGKYFAIDYLVTSRFRLDYKSYSGFAAHLVTSDGVMKTADNAIDFEGGDHELLGIRRVNESAFLVTMGTSKSFVRVESVLGLNVWCEVSELAVDVVPPKMLDYVIVNKSYSTGGFLTFLNISDNSSWDNNDRFLELLGTNYSSGIGQTGNGLPGGRLYDFSINNFSVGNYSFRWFAYDAPKFGNVNVTPFLFFNVTRGTLQTVVSLSDSVREAAVDTVAFNGSIVDAYGYGGEIVLFIGGVLVANVSGGVVINHDYNLTGNVSYNVTVYESANFSYFSEVLYVNWSDTRPPTFNETVEDLSFESGVDSLFYDFNASDAVGVDGWRVNDTVHFVIDEGSGVFENASNPAAGVYAVAVFVNDSSGNVNDSFVFSVTTFVNATPFLFVYAPLVEADINYTSDLRANFSVNDSDVVGCGLYVDSVLVVSNASVDDGVFSYLNGSLASVGNYSWWVNCSDGFSVNVSDERFYNFWTVPPVLVPTQSLQTSYVVGYAYWWNLSIIDEHGVNNDSVVFELTSGSGVTNYSYTNFSNGLYYWESDALAADNYTVRWFANDSYGAYYNSMSDQAFTLSKAVSDINLSLNGLSDNINLVVGFNFTIFAAASQGNLSLFINGTLNVTGASPLEVNHVRGGAGVDFVVVNASESQNFSSGSVGFNVTWIDSPLTVVVSAPANNTISASALLVANVTVISTSDTKAYCNFSVNGVLVSHNFSVDNGSLTSFNYSFGSTGSHRWSVECNDSLYYASTGNVSYVYGLFLPEVFLNITTVGGFQNFSINVSMRCRSNLTDEMDYNMTFNDVEFFRGVNVANDTLVTNVTVANDGVNWLWGACSDVVGTSVKNFSQVVYAKNFVLWDEVDNTVFDVSDADSVKLYYDDNSTVYDFKVANSSYVNFTSFSNEKLRFEIGYSSGVIIPRWVDVSLADEDVSRVCANKENVTHYEQLIYSASSKRVVMRSVFSDCLVAADYTRFAYQNSLILRAYTIDAFTYYLYVYSGSSQVLLSSLDGGVGTDVNLDTVEFNANTEDFTILGDGLSSQKVSDSEVLIRYQNLAADNDDIEVSITNLNTGEVVLVADDFADNNNFTILFNFATLQNVSNNTLFQIGVSKTVGGEVSSFSRYFNVGGEIGVIASGLALLLSIFLFVFGFSFTVARLSFSWFGIFVTMASIVILGMAVSAWYTLFLQSIMVIILVYSVIVMVKQNSGTVS